MHQIFLSKFLRHYLIGALLSAFISRSQLSSGCCGAEFRKIISSSQYVEILWNWRPVFNSWPRVGIEAVLTFGRRSCAEHAYAIILTPVPQGTQYTISLQLQNTATTTTSTTVIQKMGTILGKSRWTATPRMWRMV